MKTGGIAIVGGESLMGREVRELLAESKVPGPVTLIGVGEDAATLSVDRGEAVVITPLDVDSLLRAPVAFLAGSAASSRKALALAGASKVGPVLIDLSHALEDDPSARLRAPVVEPAGFAIPPKTIHVVAHPAAISLALFLGRLHSGCPVRRSVIHIFEPASERGQRGLDELQKQTANLFAFQPLPKEVFDAQLSFNMLSSYGSDAPEALSSIELRIERHLATLLAAGGRVPMPSLRLVQAPVFHGYSFSARVEFEGKPAAAAIAAALASPMVDMRDGDLDPPSNVGVAGQSGITVGSVEPDRNDAAAWWFWIAADNLRIAAENALAVWRSVPPRRGSRITG